MRLRAVLLFPLTVALMLLGAPLTAAVAYPVVNSCATIGVSTTHPALGESITVTGQNFDADGHVRLVLDSSRLLRRVTADANGSFTTTVTMPSDTANTGNHVIHARGGKTNQPADCPGEPEAMVTIQGGSSEGAGAPSGNPGGTSFTGVDIGLLLAVAAALIGVGVALNRKSRGRRTAHVS